MDSNALTELAARLWQPWAAAWVLAIAAIVTIATMAVQLRGLPAGVRGVLRSHGPARTGTLAALLVGTGGGALGAGALAVQWGGRGAIVWMWITMVLVMAWRFGEAALHERDGGAKTSTPSKPSAVAVASMLVAIAVAGAIAGQQTGALVDGLWDTTPLRAAIALGVVAVPLLWLDAGRRLLLRLAPLALLAWVVLALMLLSRDELQLQLALGDAWSEAFGLRASTVGVIAGGAAQAFAEGVLAAAIAGGIGPAGAPSTAPSRTAMLAPLLGVGLCGSLAALATATAPQRDSLVLPEPLPLERNHSRGLRPSQQVGQTIVLPTDTPLRDGGHYAFRIRGNPRGTPFAKLETKDNAVILPAWAVAQDVHEIVFRMKEKDPASKLMSWDVRIPCNREVIPGSGGADLLKLTPVNPDLELKKLVAYYELSAQPYVPLADFSFIGKVDTAQSPDSALGEHLAMYEAEGADRPFNPKLHEFFRGGFRGPYADIETERPPWAWITVPGFDAEIGTRVALRLPASPRGEPLLRLNRAGGAESPPWDVLMGARELVLRHNTDPEQDIVVPVKTKLDGYRIRYEPLDPQWEDFRKLASMTQYAPTPFVRVRDVDFEAEVHGDTRLPPEHAGRRALVPLHALAEPQGAWGEVLPYQPHPMELVAAGMHGPVLARDGAASVAGRLRDESPEQPRWLGHLAALAGFVLSLGAAAAWTESLASRWSPRLLAPVIGGAMVAGGAMQWPVAQAFTALVLALAAALGGVAVLRGLSVLRAAARSRTP
ncbi:MAG: hypothetical protein K1X88_05140 [Nannocystaceae bacterium]|nr:hypothetical protein [Nannocystaceae bacterium]